MPTDWTVPKRGADKRQVGYSSLSHYSYCTWYHRSAPSSTVLKVEKFIFSSLNVRLQYGFPIVKKNIEGHSIPFVAHYLVTNQLWPSFRVCHSTYRLGWHIIGMLHEAHDTGPIGDIGCGMQDVNVTVHEQFSFLRKTRPRNVFIVDAISKNDGFLGWMVWGCPMWALQRYHVSENTRSIVIVFAWEAP